MCLWQCLCEYCHSCVVPVKSQISSSASGRLISFDWWGNRNRMCLVIFSLGLVIVSRYCYLNQLESSIICTFLPCLQRTHHCQNGRNAVQGCVYVHLLQFSALFNLKNHHRSKSISSVKISVATPHQLFCNFWSAPHRHFSMSFVSGS